VRFSERSDSRLASIAAQTGLTKAELIRIAVDEFIANTAERGEVVQRHPMSQRKANKPSKATEDEAKLQPWNAHEI